MGKAKKLRAHSRKGRTEPLAEAMEEDTAASTDIRTSTDAPKVVNGLESMNPVTREGACVALASIFGDDRESEEKSRLLERFVRAGVIKRLLPRLVDPSPIVTLHAIGAMRNMSVTGGLEICEVMCREDVVLPVLAVIDKYAASLSIPPPASTADPSESASKPSTEKKILEEALLLLGNLCESSDLAVQQTSQKPQTLQYILRCLDASSLGSVKEIQGAAAQLLLVLSDQNPALSRCVGQLAGAGQLLLDIVAGKVPVESLLQRLLVAGAVLSMATVDLNKHTGDGNVIGVVVPLLAEVIRNGDSQGMKAKAKAICEQEAETEKEVAAAGGDIELDMDKENQEEGSSELKKKVQALRSEKANWKNGLRTINLALELLTNLAALAEDETDKAAAADEEEWETDDEEGMENSGNVPDASTPDVSSSPVCIALMQSGVIVSLLQLFHELFAISPTGGIQTELFEQVLRTRMRCCSCLINVVQNLPVRALPQSLSELIGGICSLFTPVAHEFGLLKPEEGNELVASLTALLWALLRRAETEGSKAETQTPTLPLDSSLLTIIENARIANSEEARVNAVGMLGCMGKRCKGGAENETIGKALLASLKDSSLLVVSEALNSIFDVYGDVDHDDVFVSLSFLPALQTISNEMRDKIRRDGKRLDREVIAQAKEARLNLVRFIKYKSSNQS